MNLPELLTDLAALTGRPVRLQVTPEGLWNGDNAQYERMVEPNVAVAGSSYETFVNLLNIRRRELAEAEQRKFEAVERGVA